MYLLDTNVFSELRKRDRCDPRVARWFAGVDDADIHASVLVVGELRRGVERVARRDPDGARAIERWLLRLSATYGERLLPVDHAVADMWGRINVPNPLPAVDGLMAATALAHDLTFVTRNIRDVEASGARLLNPWEPA